MTGHQLVHVLELVAPGPQVEPEPLFVRRCDGRGKRHLREERERGGYTTDPRLRHREFIHLLAIEAAVEQVVADG